MTSMALATIEAHQYAEDTRTHHEKFLELASRTGVK